MTEKKVIILRGVSGAGKSTYTKIHFPGAVVCSADSFFLDKEGKYYFNPQQLGAAHESSKRSFKKALVNGSPLVVVDNTNTKMWEMKPYIQMAKQFGYDISFVRISIPVEAAAKRNVHGVPTEAIKRMADRMEELPTELSHKEKIIDFVQ